MRRESARRRRLVIVTVVSATILSGGVGVASILNLGNQSPELPHPSGAPGDYSNGHLVAGRGLTAAEATAQVLAGLAGTPVHTITLGSPPSTSGITGAPWVTVGVVGVNPSSIESNWFGALAQGAVADLMRSDAPTTQAVIGGGEVVGLNNTGIQVSNVLGTGFVVGGQKFASPSDDALRAHVHEVALKFGLEVRMLTIVHPLNSAMSVSFTVPDSATMSWTIDELRAELDGSPKMLEGSFIQIYSSSGQWLLSSVVAYRTGLGGLSFAPGQDARFGAVHGHSPQP